jgi:4-amino-4-deoxy-L-arabinose transferase-like glycosyltransferase
MVLCAGLFSIYAQFFPYYSFNESIQLVRYPPVSRFLNLTIYFAFGVSHTGPRILQFTFYLLSAVYLYRTILLFREKETALLGATIYLFSPILYSYAFTASLASGTVFFSILTSFYFLRFIKDEDDRDLILATFFIGTGFLYKRGLLIMFFVCFTYLLLNRRCTL